MEMNKFIKKLKKMASLDKSHLYVKWNLCSEGMIYFKIMLSSGIREMELKSGRVYWQGRERLALEEIKSVRNYFKTHRKYAVTNCPINDIQMNEIIEIVEFYSKDRISIRYKDKWYGYYDVQCFNPIPDIIGDDERDRFFKKMYNSSLLKPRISAPKSVVFQLPKQSAIVKVLNK